MFEPNMRMKFSNDIPYASDKVVILKPLCNLAHFPFPHFVILLTVASAKTIKANREHINTSNASCNLIDIRMTTNVYYFSPKIASSCPRKTAGLRLHLSDKQASQCEAGAFHMKIKLVEYVNPDLLGDSQSRDHSEDIQIVFI